MVVSFCYFSIAVPYCLTWLKHLKVRIYLQQKIFLCPHELTGMEAFLAEKMMLNAEQGKVEVNQFMPLRVYGGNQLTPNKQGPKPMEPTMSLPRFWSLMEAVTKQVDTLISMRMCTS